MLRQKYLMREKIYQKYLIKIKLSKIFLSLIDQKNRLIVD